MLGHIGDDDVPLLLEFVNGRHGTAWSLVEKLPGGHQLGAYELRAPEGTRAVL